MYGGASAGAGGAGGADGEGGAGDAGGDGEGGAADGAAGGAAGGADEDEAYRKELSRYFYGRLSWLDDEYPRIPLDGSIPPPSFRPLVYDWRLDTRNMVAFDPNPTKPGHRPPPPEMMKPPRLKHSEPRAPPGIFPVIEPEDVPTTTNGPRPWKWKLTTRADEAAAAAAALAEAAAEAAAVEAAAAAVAAEAAAAAAAEEERRRQATEAEEAMAGTAESERSAPKPRGRRGRRGEGGRKGEGGRRGGGSSTQADTPPSTRASSKKGASKASKSSKAGSETDGGRASPSPSGNEDQQSTNSARTSGPTEATGGNDEQAHDATPLLVAKVFAEAPATASLTAAGGGPQGVPSIALRAFDAAALLSSNHGAQAVPLTLAQASAAASGEAGARQAKPKKPRPPSADEIRER